MAAITIGSGVTVVSTTSTAAVGVAGETGIVAGSAIYKKVSDSRWYRAQATVNMTDTTVVSAVGMALAPATSAGDGLLHTVSNYAEINLGTSLTDKSKHYLITTNGTLAEYSDLASSSYIQWWGISNGSNFIFYPHATGVTK